MLAPNLVVTAMFVSYLHVAQLGKRLVAIIQLANEWLDAFVGLEMSANVASLGEGSSALRAREGALSSVAAHVSLPFELGR